MPPLNPQTLQIHCLNKDVVPLQTYFIFSFEATFTQSAVTRRVTVPCYPTIRTTILTQGRWRSGQPLGEPARNNIPVSWQRAFVVFFHLLLSLGRTDLLLSCLMITRTEKKITTTYLPTYHCEASHRPSLQPFQPATASGRGSCDEKLTNGRWFACSFTSFFFPFFFNFKMGFVVLLSVCVCARACDIPYLYCTCPHDHP